MHCKKKRTMEQYGKNQSLPLIYRVLLYVKGSAATVKSARRVKQVDLESRGECGPQYARASKDKAACLPASQSAMVARAGLIHAEHNQRRNRSALVGGESGCHY